MFGLGIVGKIGNMGNPTAGKPVPQYAVTNRDGSVIVNRDGSVVIADPTPRTS